MARFFVSDLHINHKNVIDFCDRPYSSVEEMDEAIIEQWNLQVNPKDTVYFLGDFGINKKKILDPDIVNKLNGKKHAIIGNHDLGHSRLNKNKNVESIKNKYLKAGWETVSVAATLILKDGTQVIMTHLPPSNEYDKRYSEYKVTNNPKLNYLHGHLHGHYLKKDNMIDVAFDAELRLRTEDEIIETFNDERNFIPTRLTDKYKENDLFLVPFKKEVKRGYLREVKDGDLVLFNYTEKCTYDKAWNETTLSSRGLIYDTKKRELVALPFKKFFNLSELDPEKQQDIVSGKPPYDKYKVQRKHDGSLGIVFNHNDKWCVATRGSFTSEQAIKAQEMLESKYDMSKIDKDLTILVEIIYPENRIVTDYGDQEKLILLSIFNRKTEKESGNFHVQLNARSMGMELTQEYDYTIKEMIELQKTLPKDEEGFVVRFDNGERIKIKGHEYLRHHRLISQITPLTFWENMVNGLVDRELLEQLPEENEKQIQDIKSKLEYNYMSLKNDIELKYEEIIQIVNYKPEYNGFELKKKIGLYTKDNKYKHSSALFLILNGNISGIDRYIKTNIRPTNNII